MIDTPTRKLGASTPVQPSAIRAKSGLVLVNMGPSGAGKTTLLETLYDSEEHAKAYAPVCVLDVDGKAHVLRDSPHLDVYKCLVWEQCDAHSQALNASTGVYKTICWDGLAIMQSKSHKHQNLHKIDNAMLRQSAYGKSNVEMVAIAEQAKILAERGINVIFNIWSTSADDLDDGITKIMADFTNALRKDFLGIMDFVVYTECAPAPKPYPPIMRTGGSQKYATRTAVSPDSPLRGLPATIRNPNLGNILDSWHGAPWKSSQ